LVPVFKKINKTKNNGKQISEYIDKKSVKSTQKEQNYVMAKKFLDPKN